MPTAVARASPAGKLAAGPKGRTPWSLLAPLGVLGILLVMPGLPAPATERRGADIAAEKLRKLEQRARELKNLSVEVESKELAKVSQQMKKLVTQVRQGKLDRKQALAKLARLQEDVAGIRKDLKAQKKSLAELGKNSETKSMADSISKGRMDEAKRAAQKLAGKLSEGKLDASAKSGLQDSLSKMAEDSKGANGALAEAAKKASEALGKGQAGEFGSQMSKLAESLKNAKGGSSSDGESGEFGDAMADLDDAQQDLSGQGSERPSASNRPHCENCGRKKNPGGN